LFLGLFNEFSKYYGPNVNLTFGFNILADNSDFLSVNKANGIEVGKKQNTSLTLLILCSNETTP